MIYFLIILSVFLIFVLYVLRLFVKKISINEYVKSLSDENINKNPYRIPAEIDNEIWKPVLNGYSIYIEEPKKTYKRENVSIDVVRVL